MSPERAVGIPQRVHLVGVGGMHMSGIARILSAWGHRVSGSDMRLSPLTDALVSLGITVLEGHRAENVAEAELVVTTSAAKEDNPELVEARRRGVPILKRAQFVARLLEGRQAICIAGTHGKTTTTGLVASMLVRAGRSPTYLVGGEVRDLGTNAAPGDGDEIVVEADEFDRAFLEYHPDLAVVLNVEPDHLDIYGSFDALAGAFGQFMAQVKPGGRLIAGADSPKLRDLLRAGGIAAEVETYGLSQGADWAADELETPPQGGQEFVVRHGGQTVGRFQIALPGRHNVTNALAGIAAGQALGLPVDAIREALGAYQGARRRFELVGEADGVVVMDDYAHHPTEVSATVAAARERFTGRRLLAVFQPHTYSRTRYLLESLRTCFRELDELLVLATYAAREPESAGMDARALAETIEAPPARYVATFEEAAEAALELLRPGDVFFTIGAGDVDAVGPLVVDGLRKREGQTGKRGSNSGTSEPQNRATGQGSSKAQGFQGSIPAGLVEALEEVMPVRLDEPLARHTTLGIGGPADAYVVARDADQLAGVAGICRRHDVPFFVLGAGSNILVSDAGIRGVVVENQARAVSGPEPDGRGELIIRAESGASFAGMARDLARQGFAGLEWASGIPGTLGGAVVYNAGAYGGCLADVLRSVTVVNGTGTVRDVPAEELELVYRGSAFTRGGLEDRVVLAAEFTVWPGEPAALMRRVHELDQRRLAAQPRGRNAGSVFKNTAERPAWRLIDQVGLRGCRIRDAQISEKHCNFFVNMGRARAGDMKALIDLARDRVRAEFGVELALEIGLVGDGFDG